MKSTIISLALLACLALAGCESKQAKLDKLKAQYAPMYRQYFNDCIGSQQDGSDAYFKGTPPKIVSPQEEAVHNQKCAQEQKRLTAIEQQIQHCRSKAFR